MVTVTVALLVSFITSVCISNIVGIHYLRKLDRDWEDVFVRMKNITLEEISKRNPLNANAHKSVLKAGEL